MSLTILEANKNHKGEDLRNATVEIYAETSDILRVLPMMPIDGNSLRYDQEDVLPGIGFRGVNEAYTESAGVVNPVVETLAIAGGDVDVDRFIDQTVGSGLRSAREVMKIKALAHKWTYTFIKGDSTSNPKEFDGLQTRVTGGQLVEAGNTSGGDALSLLKLDEAIDSVDSPTHLMMSKGMRRLLTSGTRTAGVVNHLTYGVDEFGRQITKYADLPILIADENGLSLTPLGFNEVGGGGGGSVCTSIYVLSVGDGMLSGIQNGDMQVRDLGERQEQPQYRTRIEWFSGLAVWHPRAVARLRGIKNAAITL